MLDIKDFSLNTPMKCKKYMRLKITDIPDKIIKEYNLQELVTEDGYVSSSLGNKSSASSDMSRISSASFGIQII